MAALARDVASSRSTTLAHAIAGASLFVAKMVSIDGVVMNERCSDDSVEAVGRLLAAHGSLAFYSTERASALLKVYMYVCMY